MSRLTWWWWGGKDKEPAPSESSVQDWGFGFREQGDSLKFRPVRGPGPNVSSPSRKVKRKWKSREERRRVDKEYDMVLVPSDGACLTGSESDDSDWSIGWLEPHAPGFQSDDEAEDSFGVLVPCYRNGCKALEVEEESSNRFSSAIKSLPIEYSTVALIEILITVMYNGAYSLSASMSTVCEGTDVSSAVVEEGVKRFRSSDDNA
nr:Amelogenin, X like [Ipomoea batatas]